VADKVVLSEAHLGSVERELLDAVKVVLSENPKMQYHVALKRVARDNPELGRRYTAEMRGLSPRQRGGQ
jgi:hypothetical protein